jgi:antitoxin component YwqK of YwqJK toxin-antitoxin module
MLKSLVIAVLLFMYATCIFGQKTPAFLLKIKVDKSKELTTVFFCSDSDTLSTQTFKKKMEFQFSIDTKLRRVILKRGSSEKALYVSLKGLFPDEIIQKSIVEYNVDMNQVDPIYECLLGIDPHSGQFQFFTKVRLDCTSRLKMPEGSEHEYLLVFKKDSTPVTGTVIDRYGPNGLKKYEGTYKDGAPNGLMQQWYENGKKWISHQGFGQENGSFRSWHKNGVLGYHCNLINDQENGIVKSWYENGQLEYELNKTMGKTDGVHKEWYKNGQLSTEHYYKLGEKVGVCKNWHENGQLGYEATFKNGNLDGLCTFWYKNGQKEQECNWINNLENGILKGWHENGQLEYELNKAMGKTDGVHKEWYKNGQLSSEHYYKLGEEVGVWKNWHENGQLKREEIWNENGSVSRSWDENGKQKGPW